MKIPRWTLLIITVLSLVGSLAIIFSTRWGPWAFSDSVEYIVSARNLLQGKGLGFYAPSGTFERLTLHPPLYPLLLSAFGLFGADLLAATHWLNVFLFGATIFTTGVFTYRLLRSSWLALILSAIVLTMPTLVDVYSGAMSEPLFIFTATLSVYLLALYLAEGDHRWMIPAAITGGLAFLSRYPGIAIITTGLIGILFLNRLLWWQRLRDLLTYSAISLTPTGFWLVWIYLHTQTLSSRHFSFEINFWQALIPFRLELSEIFWSWLPFPKLLPSYSYQMTFNLLLVSGVLLLLGFAFSLTRMERAGCIKWPLNREFCFVFLWIVALLAYLGLLAASYVFTTPTPDLIPRTLLPVQLFLVYILLGASLFFIQVLRLPRWSALIPILITSVVIISNAQSSWRLIRTYNQAGAGFTAAHWHKMDIVEAVKMLPVDIPIITNEAAAVLLLTDRAGYDFCNIPCDQPENVRYGDNKNDEVQRIFQDEGAALVLIYARCPKQDQTWLVERLAQIENLTRGLMVAESSCNGAIYFYP